MQKKRHPLISFPDILARASADIDAFDSDVWLGSNVIVLPGITIGNNVVVAAGDVVTKDVPDNNLVCVGGGTPSILQQNAVLPFLLLSSAFRAMNFIRCLLLTSDGWQRKSTGFC